MIEPNESYKLYRQIVPESDYEECKGCHAGSAKCPIVHYLHRICPCNNCLLKTSCTEYCEKYLGFIINIAKENKEQFRLLQISKKGYSIEFKSRDGRKVRVGKWLKRWMEPNHCSNIPIAGFIRGKKKYLGYI